MQQIIVEVPDQVASHLSGDNTFRSRRFLEAFLLQEYAEGKVSSGWIGEVLGIGFYGAETFLKEHNARPTITAEEHAKDMANLERLLAQ